MPVGFSQCRRGVAYGRGHYFELMPVMIRMFTINEGKEYLLQVHQYNGHNLVYLSVRSIKYFPCPAVVIVSDGIADIAQLLSLSEGDVCNYMSALFSKL